MLRGVADHRDDDHAQKDWSHPERCGRFLNGADQDFAHPRDQRGGCQQDQNRPLDAPCRDASLSRNAREQLLVGVE